jgi:pimeloyl-ACP methyl ester carboxylesterase
MPYAEVNDIQIYYEFHGPSNGTPLVLIEGWGVALWGWFRQLPELTKNHRVLVFDNRGVGKTSKPDHPYTAEMTATDTKLLLDDLGIDKAHILGTSMGGFIAQQVALSYPEKVTSLILAMTHFSGENHVPIPSDTMMALFAFPTETISKEEAIKIRRSVAYSPEFTDNNKNLFRLMDKWLDENPQPEKARINQANIGNTLDSEKDLHKIQAPTLIIHGESDRIVSIKNAEKIHERIPNSKLVILKDAPHRIEIVEYKKFNTEILSFLADVNNHSFQPESEKILV